MIRSIITEIVSFVYLVNVYLFLYIRADKPLVNRLKPKPNTEPVNYPKILTTTFYIPLHRNINTEIELYTELSSSQLGVPTI